MEHIQIQYANSPTSTATLVTADHTIAVPPPPTADTIRAALTPMMTTACSSTTITATNTTTTGTPPPPVNGVTSDVPLPSTITTNTPTSSDVVSAQTYPHCNHTFHSHTDLVGQLRIYLMETSESLPTAPTRSRRIHLNRPNCSRIFSNRMGLLGHIQENMW
ncbi:hypothetical protein SprV_0301211600 [Sparganum proliferum]